MLRDDTASKSRELNRFGKEKPSDARELNSDGKDLNWAAVEKLR